MPYRFEVQLGGWGAVHNPLNPDELIPVENDEIVVEDGDLADALGREFDALKLVESPDQDSDADHDESFDADSFLDRTPMTAVIEDIESGMVDAHLEQLAEQADRMGVQDAIADRMDS